MRTYSLEIYQRVCNGIQLNRIPSTESNHEIVLTKTYFPHTDPGSVMATIRRSFSSMDIEEDETPKAKVIFILTLTIV